MKTPKLLIIAGSDPTSGAGIQSDCLTAYSLDVYPMTVVTSITVQNDMGVHQRHDLEPELVMAQLEGLLSRFQFDAVKIGMLGNANILSAVSDCLSKYRDKIGPVILDPVLKASNAFTLSDDSMILLLREKLMPLLELMTPNLNEYVHIFHTQTKKPIPALADVFSRDFIPPDTASCHLLIKGGHFEDTACDYLLLKGTNTLIPFRGSLLKVAFSHGTGCTLSTAIASFLIRGESLDTAIAKAKAYLRDGLVNPHLFEPQYGAICKRPPSLDSIKSQEKPYELKA